MLFRLTLYFKLILKVLFDPRQYPALYNILIFKYNNFFKKLHVSNYPISIVVYTNKRCNFKCEYCFELDYLNSADTGQYDLTTDQFQKNHRLQTSQALNTLRNFRR